MTKSEIIESTLKAMRGKWESAEPELQMHDDNDSSGRYDFVVIRTLAERLPEVEFKTCSDFSDLSAKCCEICHTLYPHYEMHIEDLPDGGKAWICCAMRSALRREKTNETGEEIDLEEAL